ncbi:MAG: translation initiation factor [Clostridiales bacterium]|jgi:translation initiation factor IF-3|nr:translation initiation factor [Clostridiales bacterium]
MNDHPLFFISNQEVYLIKAAQINEEIRDPEVRVIGDEGEQLGVMSGKEAYQLAVEKKLDLVKIAPNAKPPVCKIMDYGKFRYEQQKRDKEARKKQKSATLKEVRLGLNIEKNDLETKAKSASKFLLNGDKVKVSLRFRGREMGYTQQGYEVIKRFSEAIEEAGDLEKPAKMEGRSLVAFYAPKK